MKQPLREGNTSTGFSSEIGTKLRDWAVGQAGGSCYSQAALSSNDSKTLYRANCIDLFYPLCRKDDLGNCVVELVQALCSGCKFLTSLSNQKTCKCPRCHKVRNSP